MLLSKKFACLRLAALFMGAALAISTSAEAQAPPQTPKPHPHRKLAPPPEQSSPAPLAPGVELQTSVYEPVGTRNRYFTETIGPGVTGSLGQTGRDGQTLPLPDSSVLKFGF